MSDVLMTAELFSEKTLKESSDSNQVQKTQSWIEVCLKISAQGAYRVYDEFDENDIIKNNDDSFTITTSLPDNRWLIQYILSFGADIEVLAPQNIRDILRKELELIIRKY